jgi:ABC-type antimicrobial peptide transport system ATPase subunit
MQAMEPTSEVAAFNTRLEADLAVAILDEAGIDALVTADNLGGAFPMMQMITGGYKVLVLTAVADEAREIIATDAADEPRSAPRQPAIYRFLSKLTPAQMAVLLAALGASIMATLYAVTQGPL